MAVRGVYINLDRSHERREAMQLRLRELGMDWVGRLAAVEGSSLDMPPACRISAGELGCFHSHLQAIETAAADDFQFIFEDDVELSADLPSILHEAQLRTLAGYDIVVLDCQPVAEIAAMAGLWRCLQNQLAEPRDLLDFDAARRLKGVEVFVAKGLYAWGAQAYVVTPKGRSRLPAVLRSCLDDGPPGPVDILFKHAMLDGRIDAAVIVPFLATPRLESHTQTHMTGRGQFAHRLAVLSAMRRLFFGGRIGDMSGYVAPLLEAGAGSGPQLELLAALFGSAFTVAVRDGDLTVDRQGA